mgnify:CR=1 FL=1
MRTQEDLNLDHQEVQKMGLGKVFKTGFGWTVDEDGKVVFVGDVSSGHTLVERLNELIDIGCGRYSWQEITLDELGGFMFFVDSECDDVDDDEEGVDWNDDDGLGYLLEEFMNDVGRTEDSEKFYYLGAIWRRDDTHYWKV